MGIATLIPKAIPFKFLFDQPVPVERVSSWSVPRSAVTGREMQFSEWTSPVSVMTQNELRLSVWSARVSRKTRRRRRG